MTMPENDCPECEACCILQICCPPPEAAATLAAAMMKDGIDEEYARQCAKWIYKHFDLAPHGTLQPFKDAIAKAVKDHKA